MIPFRNLPTLINVDVDECRNNRAACAARILQARSRGRDGRLALPPPYIFRFELNPATKVEFCLLKWAPVNGSYSFQALSIIVGLCTVVLLCNLELCKGTKSYFCCAKNNQQP